MGQLTKDEELKRKRITKLNSCSNQQKRKNKNPARQVVDISNRRSFRENREIRRRLDKAFIRDEKNSETTIFEGSHEIILRELPRSFCELKRFLGTLSKDEQIKIKRLVEDITLDARVHDRNFTCTMTYLRLNKDPEITALYQKIRAAIFTNLRIMLPEIPDEVA